MNWETHWATLARVQRARIAYPIHGATPFAGAAAGMTSGALIAWGTLGVVAGALIGAGGTGALLKGIGWNV
jgi:hypothetical protein